MTDPRIPSKVVEKIDAYRDACALHRSSDILIAHAALVQAIADAIEQTRGAEKNWIVAGAKNDV